MLPKNEMREMKILRFIVKLHILIIGWDGAGQWTLLSLLLILGAGNNIIITRAGYNEAQLLPAP